MNTKNTLLKLLPSLFLLPGLAPAGDSICDQVFRDRFVSAWETLDTVRVVSKAITPAGKINCTYYPDQQEKVNLLVQYETGNFEGVEYRVYYSDGSATVQGQAGKSLVDRDYENNWQLNCSAEGETMPRCSLRRGALEVTRLSGRPSVVTVGRNLRVGSDVLVRVDKNWSLTAAADTGFTDEQSRQIIHQMKNGRAIDISYQDRNNQQPTYKTVPLFGFNQALSISAEILPQLLDTH